MENSTNDLCAGDIPYLEYVYPNPKQFFSFLYTWCRVLLVHTGYSAALCTVVGSFTLVAFPIPGIDNVQKDWIQKGISCFAVLIIFFMTAFSNKCATMGMQVLTILQISIVSFVVICGIAHAGNLKASFFLLSFAYFIYSRCIPICSKSK